MRKIQWRGCRDVALEADQAWWFAEAEIIHRTKLGLGEAEWLDQVSSAAAAGRLVDWTVCLRT